MLIREYQMPVPPPSAAELMGYARVREDYAAELHSKGLYQSARIEWSKAEMYRRMVEEMAVTP